MSTNKEIIVREQQQNMTVRQMAERVNLVHEALRTVMKKGTHYGTVPGCGVKNVLLKPGADVLATMFRLVPKYDVSTNFMENGHREYTVTCSMFTSSGELLGEGVGSASTMEKKYRWRKDESGNPIENEDIADTYNTVLKVGKKRAHIDATLTVTGAADIFTQDLIDEDEKEKKPREAVKMPTAKKHDDEIIFIVPEVKESKGGTQENPWTRYDVMHEGERLSTFSVHIGGQLRTARGKKVSTKIERSEKGTKILSVVVVGRQENEDQNSAPDANANADIIAKISEAQKFRGVTFKKLLKAEGLADEDWPLAPRETLVKILSGMEAQ